MHISYRHGIEKWQVRDENRQVFNERKQEVQQWFSMPVTIYKVLIHAKQILENSVLPAGYFGEEASEVRNKIYKRDRESCARKNSRINNFEDVFNRAMDTSDPVISSISL